LYGQYSNYISSYTDLNETEYVVLQHLSLYNLGLGVFPRYFVELFTPFFIHILL
jgi:hypothetical protein